MVIIRGTKYIHNNECFIKYFLLSKDNMSSGVIRTFTWFLGQRGIVLFSSYMKTPAINFVERLGATCLGLTVVSVKTLQNVYIFIIILQDDVAK